MPSSVRELGPKASPSGRALLKGRFIVLDGPDGGGKTTQANLLHRALLEERREVVLAREPGGTPLGERLRELLLSTDGPEIGARAELFLFMAARAQMVEELVRPALEAGKIVICERYVLSSVVYQGLAGSIPAGEVEAIGRSATGGLAPDLTVILDIDAETGLRRAGRSDRIEARGRSYHERVRQGFLSLARRDLKGICVVDASRPVDVVHRDVLKLVKDVLV